MDDIPTAIHKRYRSLCFDSISSCWLACLSILHVSVFNLAQRANTVALFHFVWARPKSRAQATTLQPCSQSHRAVQLHQRLQFLLDLSGRRRQGRLGTTGIASILEETGVLFTMCKFTLERILETKNSEILLVILVPF